MDSINKNVVYMLASCWNWCTLWEKRLPLLLYFVLLLLVIIKQDGNDYHYDDGGNDNVVHFLRSLLSRFLSSEWIALVSVSMTVFLFIHTQILTARIEEIKQEALTAAAAFSAHESKKIEREQCLLSYNLTLHLCFSF